MHLSLIHIYDFKFSDLSTIAYNHLLNHPEGYKVKPKFYVISFDDPRRSHRCNPIHPDFMEDITDAYESAYTIMLNLNKTWVDVYKRQVRASPCGRATLSGQLRTPPFERRT